MKKIFATMVALLTVFAFSTLAYADRDSGGEDTDAPDKPVWSCETDEDCFGGYCEDGTCQGMDDDDWEPECEEDSDCESGKICIWGSCEEGVACENVAGRCAMSAWGGECECESGMGTGWAEGGGGDSGGEWDEEDPNTEPPPGKIPTQTECVEILERECGTKAPELSDYCNDEELRLCIKGFELVTDACGEMEEGLEFTDEVKEKLLDGEWVKPQAGYIAQCCEALGDKEEREHINEVIECLEKGGSCEECVDFDDWEEGDGEYASGDDDDDRPGKDGGKGDDNQESDDDDDSDDDTVGDGTGGDDTDAEGEESGGESVSCNCSVSSNQKGEVGGLALISLMLALGFAIVRKR